MLDYDEIKHAFFDLVVVGGGINGAAIARDASLRGLKVLLLEKKDFGSGASTKTSKLAHGGLRYLKQFEFGLVKESLYERNLLLKNAPHLVRPLKFILPVYSHNELPLWLVNLGLHLYDFFARKGNLPKHNQLTKEQILREFPDIESNNLAGGCSYYDAQMKDSRLLIENVLAAEQAGTAVLNYAEVINFLWAKGKVKGVIFRDVATDKEMTARTKVVVNATGAWSDHVSSLEPGGQSRLAPTKGVHIVVPEMFAFGLILKVPQDGRVFFVIPWEGHSLIGTTDTFFSGNPDLAKVDEADINYLLKAFDHYFPNLKLNSSSIISTFAGLRPLVAGNGIKSPSLVSRDHEINLSEGGIITVLGGKFTTHRQMAEEAVDVVISQMDSSRTFNRCCTKEIPLPGGILSNNNLKIEFEQAGLKQIQIDYLLEHYGNLSRHILDIIRTKPSESEQICADCPHCPHIFAELTYGIKYEHVKQLDDWLYRRTSVGYSKCCNKNYIEKFAGRFA